MNEEKLIKKARKGNSEAFGKLYDKHVSSIYRFILFKVNTKSEAEDITQQVFLKAWQNISGFKMKKNAKFSSWVYSIARNSVIDHYRTSKNHIDIEDVKYDQQFAIVPEISEEIDDKERLEKIKDAVCILTDDERDIIIMKFVEDLSNQEIGDALDKTQGSIRVIQHRALKKLKNHLNEKEGNN